LLNPTVCSSRYKSLSGSDKERSRWHCDDGTTGGGGGSCGLETAQRREEESLFGVITKLGAEFAAQRVYQAGEAGAARKRCWPDEIETASIGKERCLIDAAECVMQGQEGYVALSEWMSVQMCL
jgi:hypothetical protein